MAVALCIGCGSAEGPPLDPALTGRWVESGIDTYAVLTLEQRGSAVSGTFGAGGFGGVATRYKVTGTAHLPHVALRWTEKNGQNYHVLMDATLSADGQTLSATLSVNGESPGLVSSFRRTPLD